MSVFWMGNGGFLRLDNFPIDEAIEAVRFHVEQSGHGFVGRKYRPEKCPTCGHEKYVRGDTVFQWKRGEEWEARVREILETDNG